MPGKIVLSDPTKSIPGSTWKKLSEKKIYFGHQSVGFNIIDGIKDVMKEDPRIKLNIVQTSDPSAFKTPVFAHSAVGENTDPGSKCDDFVKLMEKGIGKSVDFAFLKFCYVDVTEGTDMQKVFDTYSSTLNLLKEKYPKTTFIHITIPLTSKQTGIKTFVKNMIKKVIGKTVRSYRDNIKRNEFNEMLMKEYEGKDPIFDLAKIESTFPDGKRSTVTKEGKSFYSLVPEYTYDGGHLNELGRKMAAQKLLVLLAKLSEKDERK